MTLPLSLDGIVTGCLLTFVVTNGSFLTMLLLGGGKITTLALLIYQQFNTTQDVAFAAAMGNVLMLAAVLCFAVSIGAALAFLFMEPATARAAFRVTS